MCSELLKLYHIGIWTIKTNDHQNSLDLTQNPLNHHMRGAVVQARHLTNFIQSSKIFRNLIVHCSRSRMTCSDNDQH